MTEYADAAARVRAWLDQFTTLDGVDPEIAHRANRAELRVSDLKMLSGYAQDGPFDPSAPAFPGGRVWSEGDPEPLEQGLLLIDKSMTPRALLSYSDPTWFRLASGDWTGPYGYKLSWRNLLAHEAPLREYRPPRGAE